MQNIVALTIYDRYKLTTGTLVEFDDFLAKV